MLVTLLTGREIASALQMNYVFVCEFEELRSPLRTLQTQVRRIDGQVCALSRLLNKIGHSNGL